MTRRSRCPAGVLGVLLVLGAAPAAASSRATNPTPAPIVSPRPTATPTLPPAALYSRHARRVAQAYLRMKLLELREADLERVRDAVERGLGPDAFLPTPRPARASP
jgi:hypothetical protein